MKVEKGDLVGVRYTGRLDNGEVFDSNAEEGADALEFRVGAGQVIAGFESAVMGLAKGESRTVRIPPSEAYGERDDKLVTKLDRAVFEGGDVEVGQHLDLEDSAGNTYHADVVAVDEKAVTVDLNHHLAGEALTFDIKVETIERA
jgi:peptidylprolyl isomerase